MNPETPAEAPAEGAALVIGWRRPRSKAVVRSIAGLLAVTSSIAPLISTLSVFMGHAEGIIAAVFLSIISAVALVGLGALTGLAATERRRGPSPVTAGPEGVSAGGRRIPRAALHLAWAARERSVELFYGDGQELTLDLPSPVAAARLVAQIRRWIPRDKAYELSIESPVRYIARSTAAWLTSMSTATVMIAIAHDARAGLPIIVVGAALAIYSSRRSPPLTFGADGVSLGRGEKARFVPYRAMRRVRVAAAWGQGHRVAVEVDGEWRTLVSGASKVRARLIEALLREAHGMVAAGDAAGAHVESLSPRGDEAGAWRARLDQPRQDYRAPAVDEDRLMSLLGNPAADPEQRVAAAVSLRRAPAGRARIRVAAAVSTEPSVRAALEELSEVDLSPERLDGALERIISVRKR